VTEHAGTAPAAQAGDPALVSPEPGVEEHYPSEWQYIRIALILFAITMAEVGVYYISGLQDILITVLLLMAIVKFALVALYFMHLRFDSKLFRRVFVTGIILAIIVYMIALTSLHVFSR
jgi:cytochrome c oxidase subunit 4